ncbi:hypothetical protein QTP86_025623 [Hemibagrus guttatus]|nr:hypothetical protein QTP86_025623 [Hemibagrus guttatus]
MSVLCRVLTRGLLFGQLQRPSLAGLQYFCSGVSRLDGVQRDSAATSTSPVNLSYDVYDGKEDGVPLVFLHGLFGSKSNFNSIAKSLVQRTGRKVLTVDARNHGNSAHSPGLTYEAMSKDLKHLLNQLHIGKCILIGHSMGGKTAMTTALSQPNLVERLVVVDISPVPTTARTFMKGYIDAMKEVKIPSNIPRSTARRVAEDQLRKHVKGAGGNWATVGRRSRGGRRVRRQREKRKGKSVGLRIGTLNVGTMTGKGRELADVMERRKVDILCVQETRWKGSKARSIGAGFKLFYYGVDSKRNGVGVVLKEEFVRNVLEVKRVSDRVMSLKLEIEGVMLNVVSGYAPQVGCELEEKERFWSELDEVMESIPTGERVVIGADFNGHVGEGNTGDEEVMGKFGVKERNLEGQMVVDFAKRMDMGVVNTYFQKREEHRVTYKSGGRSTQVDYILCRRGNLKEISDCKVVVGESVARQHRMVVCRMTLMVCKKKRSEIEKKTKWWKLKKEECCEEFRQKLRQALGGQVVLPDDWETTAEVIRETGRKVLGVSSGRRKEDKETWWWNEEVQDSIQRKRLAKKKWDMDRTEENRQEYKELQRRVKREVSKAKQKAYDELYTRLDTREGEKDLYRLARQRDRDGKDVQQVRVIKDRDGRVLTSEESVQRRWKEYFEELMNEENEREKRVEGVNSVEQKVDKIRKDEVRKALKRMKSGKAVGPDDIPVEVWKCLGEAAVEFLASLFNRVLESERMPEEWRRSVLVPIFKNKGDVQSCSNYRGIKLMSHTMKLWERVVEARLRKVVEICEQQYGFMPRKSTTDAIFALRILMEKYRDGQRELHCVFVDLEKAYDRVPREELWYCMRKSGVAEKYVRVVQDMYERSRTVVRCAVGQTEEFNVEVGLHQGSALSPFLFAIVMDQLSEEVRQESPWTMMFADDIVICSESREQVEENLERWRFALERRGMKVSRSKTEYMCVNEREGSGTVRLQGEEVKKVQEFKYLGSTVQSNGECGKEVKKRVQAGWNGWRKVSGVLCDQKISARIKGKVYRTVVRPAMLYGLETVSLKKRQESELEEHSVRHFLLSNLVEQNGHYAWRINLEAISNHLMDLMGFPEFNTTYDGPTLFLGGSNSEYVSSEDYPEIQRLFPYADIQYIPDAGHWIHADKPLDFISSIITFVQS